MPILVNTTSDTCGYTAYCFKDITIIMNDTVLGLDLPTTIYGGVSLVGNV